MHHYNIIQEHRNQDHGIFCLTAGLEKIKMPIRKDKTRKK